MDRCWVWSRAAPVSSLMRRLDTTRRGTHRVKPPLNQYGKENGKEGCADYCYTVRHLGSNRDLDVCSEKTRQTIYMVCTCNRVGVVAQSIHSGKVAELFSVRERRTRSKRPSFRVYRGIAKR